MKLERSGHLARQRSRMVLIPPLAFCVFFLPRQSGTSASEYLKAVATGGEDGSIVMTTTSSTTADIITLDSEGTELWTWQVREQGPKKNSNCPADRL